MFKLLTTEERQKVGHEYVIRRTIVMLSALIFVSVVGIIGLLPSYVLSNARQNEMIERTRIMNEAGSQEGGLNLQAWLNEINHRLACMDRIF